MGIGRREKGGMGVCPRSITYPNVKARLKAKGKKGKMAWWCVCLCRQVLNAKWSLSSHNVQAHTQFSPTPPDGFPLDWFSQMRSGEQDRGSVHSTVTCAA